MSDNRKGREQSTRDTEKRTQHWKQPELLPSPHPEEGYTFRWVRVSSMGDIDAANVSSKLREGWVPVKAEDHKEIVVAAIEHERFKSNIVIGGLMLCKAPNEMVQERNDYYAKQAKSQIESVDNNLMRESDSRMPMFSERKSKITFGTGN